MEYNFNLKVTASGEFTQEELISFVEWETGASCSINCDNPFMDDKAELIKIECNFDY